MSNETPRPVLTDSNSAPRRRSPRLSSPVVNSTPPVNVKRKITVRKPRKTQSHTPTDPQDSVWSVKVRRSYSRLSQGEHSFNSPQSPAHQRRETFFGFEQMLTPEVFKKVEQSTESRSQFYESLCEVTVVKEKKKRRKRLNLAELDILASKMNADFDEVEGFELVVE